MRRLWLILLLAAAPGCVQDAGPGYGELDDGGYYDGGAYYASPRPVDYDVEQRYYYRPAYAYPYGYPHYYGGYYRRYRPDHDDHRGDDGRGRERERGDRAVVAPPRESAGRGGDAVRERPSVGRPADSGASRSGPARSGGPHGRH